MAQNPKPTFTSEFSPAMTMRVMSDLKRTNCWNEMLHNNANKALAAAGALVVADPTNEALHHFLLGQYEIHQRDKAVATYSAPMRDKDGKKVIRGGKPVMVSQSIKKDIKDNEDWMVQIIAKGTAVRICLSAKAKAALKEEHKNLEGLRVY